MRAELRTSWRSWLLLGVLVALLGGTVLTASAGARRNDTALRRFVATTNTQGVNISPDFPGVARLPEVAAADVLVGEPLFRVRPDGQVDRSFPAPVAGVGDSLFYGVLRHLVRQGRFPRPDRADEAFASVEVARELHLHVGSRLTLRDMSGIIGAQHLSLPSRIPPYVGKPVQLTIVGIGVDYPDIAAASARSQGGQGAFGTITLTPAYVAAHGGKAAALYSGELLQLRPGADLGHLQHEIDAIASRHPVAPGGSNYDLSALSEQMASSQRTIHPDVVALWVFAILVGVASLLLLGQALARKAWTAAAQFPVLHALGATRRQFVLATVTPAAVVSLVGGLLAAVIAVLASPLTPVGPARVAEPDPGMAANVAILAIGTTLFVALLSAQVAAAAWLATNPSHVGATARTRRSQLVNAAAAAGMPVTATTGLRLALEPGRGASAVPLRSTLIGAVMAIAALIVAVTFNVDLARLNDTPARYGWSWNLAIDGGYVPLPAGHVGAALGNIPGVAGWAGGNYGHLIVAGQLIPAVGLDELHGAVFPSLLAGRPPRDSQEVVLGTSTLRAASARVGGTVTVQIEDRPRQLHVTGRAVLPDFERGGFSATDLGVGAVATSQIVHPTGIPPGVTYNFFLVRFTPGASEAAVRHRVETALGPACSQAGCGYFVDRRPNEVNAYGQVAWTPLLLAGILGALAAMALVHSLVSSVRRRRLDLAILKTLGFTRAQVSMAVAWQATIIVLVAVAIGLPLGIIIGRWLWSSFAGELGVAPDSLLPVAALAITVPVALIVGNLVASVPAWAAGRVEPSRILRAE
jgi:hypothetical protein